MHNHLHIGTIFAYKSWRDTLSFQEYSLGYTQKQHQQNGKGLTLLNGEYQIKRNLKWWIP
jgi:hypothetical protein